MKLVFKKPNPNLWLALVGTSTIIIGVAYVLAQQSTRLTANDIPVTMSKVIEHELDSGAVAADAVAKQQTDLDRDEIPFAIITDGNRMFLASSATLNNEVVLPPIGSFTYAKKHGSNSLTWEPDKNVRLATQILSYKDGSRFIVTGQSLTEPEKKINTYGQLALIAWIVTVVWVSLALSIEFKAKTAHKKSK